MNVQSDLALVKVMFVATHAFPWTSVQLCILAIEVYVGRQLGGLILGLYSVLQSSIDSKHAEGQNIVYTTLDVAYPLSNLQSRARILLGTLLDTLPFQTPRSNKY